MASPSKTFEIDIGTTFRLNITGVNRGNNTPFDFSTGTVRMEFRRNATSALADLTLSEGSGIVNNGESGVQITLSSEQTKLLSGGYSHRLLITVSALDYVLLRGQSTFVH